MVKRIFPFVDSRELRQHFRLGKSPEVALRLKLSTPLYWIQPDRKVLWNFELVRDYLLHGGDTPEHQALVEQYLASLPDPPKGGTPKSQPKEAA
jgi:hypothetical protein